MTAFIRLGIDSASFTQFRCNVSTPRNLQSDFVGYIFGQRLATLLLSSFHTIRYLWDLGRSNYPATPEH